MQWIKIFLFLSSSVLDVETGCQNRLLLQYHLHSSVSMGPTYPKSHREATTILHLRIILIFPPNNKCNYRRKVSAGLERRLERSDLEARAQMEWMKDEESVPVLFLLQSSLTNKHLGCIFWERLYGCLRKQKKGSESSRTTGRIHEIVLEEKKGFWALDFIRSRNRANLINWWFELFEVGFCGKVVNKQYLICCR